MKKVFLLFALVCMATAANAQFGVKRVAKYQKGEKAVYHNVEKTVVQTQMGEQVISQGSTDQYVVTDATANGYVIDITTVKVEADAPEGDIMSAITGAAAKMTEGLTIRVATDADGRAIAIQNMDEVKQKAQANLKTQLDELYAKNSQLEGVLQRDVFTAQIMDRLTEEALLSALHDSPDVMSLNGKTMMTGGIEQFTSEEGMKMKRLYVLSDKEGLMVKTTANLDMTTNELKEFIIKQMAESAPEQAEMIKQNIDALISSGALKMDVTQTADYEFFANGWLNKLTTETKSEVMGQNSRKTKTMECIEHSW
ncbi:MAG: hypothetical protein IKH53_01220 [Muribaculaceae bacterium]|nr:hypothetical protein [Muribaculaceae bacterium]